VNVSSIAPAVSGGSSSGGGSSGITISQADYDAQARQIASNPAGSFGARDIRNGNVSVGSYAPSVSINPITGARESNGNFYRTGTDGGSFMASGDKMQQDIDVAKVLGYGDISGTYKAVDVPTWQNAMRLGANTEDAYRLASDKSLDIKSLLPTPKATMLTGLDTSTEGNGTYNKDFFTSLIPALAKSYGYDDKLANASKYTGNTNPFGLSGYAAEYAYGKDIGLDEATANKAAAWGREGEFAKLPSYYDRQNPSDSVLSIKDLLSEASSGGAHDYVLKAAGFDPAQYSAEEQAYLAEGLKNRGY